jgi:hypothetical protein
MAIGQPLEFRLLTLAHQNILHHVAGIDATRYRLIEPQADHSPQGRPVFLPELVGRGGIGVRDPVQKDLCLADIAPHELI